MASTSSGAATAVLAPVRKVRVKRPLQPPSPWCKGDFETGSVCRGGVNADVAHTMDGHAICGTCKQRIAARRTLLKKQQEQKRQAALLPPPPRQQQQQPPPRREDVIAVDAQGQLWVNGSLVPDTLPLPPPRASVALAPQGQGLKRPKPNAPHHADVPAAPGQAECSICLENRAACALVPCGHRCVCNGCAANEALLKSCPLCRTPVQHAMFIYE